MNEILARLLTIRGIRAAAVYDLAGQCVGSAGEEGLMPALHALGPDIATALGDTNGRFASRTNHVIGRFAEGTVVVRKNAKAMLAVVGDARVDMTDGGANVAVNMAFTVLGSRVASRRPPANP